MFFKKHIQKQIMLFSFVFFSLIKTEAQKVRVIDNKGTLKTAGKNKVFKNNSDPNGTSPTESTKRVEGDIWYNPTDKITKVWDTYIDSNGILKGKWEILIGEPIPIHIHKTSDTAESFKLEDFHHTIIVEPPEDTSNVTIEFPKPSDAKGKIYRIKNLSDRNIDLVCVMCGSSPFLDNEGNSLTELNRDIIFYIFQSDGVSWQQINNP